MDGPSQQAQAEPHADRPEVEGPPVLRNVMVSYIPPTVDAVQLRHLFAQYGVIESLRLMADPNTGRSKGYAFVKYCRAGDASSAIQYLNGFPLVNKTIRVAYADEPKARQALAAQQHDSDLRAAQEFQVASWGQYMAAAQQQAAAAYAQQQRELSLQLALDAAGSRGQPNTQRARRSRRN